MSLPDNKFSFSQEFPRRVTVLRFPLLLLIIAIHASHGSQLPELEPNSFFNSVFWRLFSHSAVPFYFLISGVFVTFKLGDMESLSCRIFYRKRFFAAGALFALELHHGGASPGAAAAFPSFSAAASSQISEV